MLHALPLAFGLACGAGDIVVVGSKDALERDLVAEIVAQDLEARGVQVERRFQLGDTPLAHEAITRGEIDLYVESTGRALVDVLAHAPLGDPDEVFDLVAREYLDRWDLVVGSPFGYENAPAFVVRKADAESLNLRTIADLSRAAGAWTIGMTPQFRERADGFAAVSRAYGLEFAALTEIEGDALYRALSERQIDVAVGRSTDGSIDLLDLVILRDDRRTTPPSQAVPVVRRKALERHPAAWDALQALSGKLSPETLRALHRAVVTGEEDPATIVRRWRATRDRDAVAEGDTLR